MAYDVENNGYYIVLVTPFMMRVHKELKESGEVAFVDATSCVDSLKTGVIPFICAGPGGAAPLVILFASSQDAATLQKGEIRRGVLFFITCIWAFNHSTYQTFIF